MMNCPPGGPRYPRPPWIGLAKMCEELAEVIQVAAKLAVCPNGEYFDGKDLVEWLQEEMADASAILQFVEHQNNLVVDQKRVEEKYRKFCEWFGVGMDAFSADREDVSDDEFIDVRAAMPTAVSDITKPVMLIQRLVFPNRRLAFPTRRNASLPTLNAPSSPGKMPNGQSVFRHSWSARRGPWQLKQVFRPLFFECAVMVQPLSDITNL